MQTAPPIPVTIAAQALELAQRPYTAVVKRITDDSGTYYHASVLELDGCQTTGDTMQEIGDHLQEAILLWIETSLVDGDAIPMPLDRDDIGRIMRARAG